MRHTTKTGHTQPHGSRGQPGGQTDGRSGKGVDQVMIAAQGNLVLEHQALLSVPIGENQLASFSKGAAFSGGWRLNAK